ncbi:MAG: hypothetical protein ACI4UJ_09905 [Candidatus Cryptobacteroides sp.]
MKENFIGRMATVALRLAATLAAMTIIALSYGCENQGSRTDETAVVRIILGASNDYAVKSALPDEELIHDVNLFLFDAKGRLEDHIYADKLTIGADGRVEIDAEWLCGTGCRIMACANFGYRMDTGSLDELLAYRYHIAYPDEYSRGIPMSGTATIAEVSSPLETVNVEMIRMMARISVRIDRSNLAKGVTFNVSSVEIGGSPKSVNAFAPGKAAGTSDIFNKGFVCSGTLADNLNIEESPGRSREARLYLLENMQGELLPDAKNEKDKVLEISDALSSQCSYVEIKAEYNSDDYCTPPGEWLVYRFYLGDSPSNFDVERNCAYSYVIKPDGTGIEEDSWRVDKSSLIRKGAATLSISPGQYIEGNVGDEIHIRVNVVPEDAKVDIGKEELEFDRNNGIYDYAVDEDGRGVVLKLKSKGSGLLYVEAGNPASDAAIIVIVVV